MASYAFVTLLTSDSYLPGALTAVHSLLDVEGVKPNTPFETVCLVTPGTVGQNAIQALNKTFDQVVGVGEITSSSLDNLDLLGRRDLVASLTKLHLFRLTQYTKVIFLDADTLVLRPISHLFTLPAAFSAAPDSGWPDAFNSGFMVATPSDATFESLIEMMSDRGSWDGGDQGLLNDFFPDWNRLSFTYNVTPSAYYTYAPAYKRHGPDVNVLHFIGSRKPWHRQTRDTYVPDAAQSDYHGLVNKWFDVYEHHFGTTSTILVASRVVKPPGSFKSTYSELRPHTPSPPRSPLPAPTAIRPAAPPPTWDPARSSPPLGGAHQMAVPIVEHYENAWDSTGSPTGAFIPPASYAPPPKETHEWYRDVMGSAPPDRSLVKNVFPWEKNAPRRHFPKDASPPPAAEPTPPPPPPATTFVPAHERTFVNAWDNVPGIDRYAASLAKATGKKLEKLSLQEGSDDMGGRTSSLSEPTKSDASSRDGDDEDDSDSASSDETPRIPLRLKKPKDAFELTPAPLNTTFGGSVTGAPSSPTKTRKNVSLPSPRLREDLPPFASPSSPSSKRGATLSPTSPGPRFPTSATSPRLAAQAARNHAAARLSGTGDGPPVLRATRVFSPDTDTTVVKEQGLAALQRFVENMEAAETGRSPTNGRGPPGLGMGGPGGAGGGRGSGGSWR